MTAPSPIWIRRWTARAVAVLAGVAVLLAVPFAAHAGTMSIAWDPVSDPDLASYRIYVGTSPQSGNVATLNVGTANSVDLVGLPDCSALYVAVKAVDFSGNESTGFSNAISGMTQPSITSISPASLTQGDEDRTLRINGGSFTAGMDIDDLVFTEDEVRVVDVNFRSCTALDVIVSVGPFVSNPGDPGYNGDGTTVELVDPAEEDSFAVSASAPDGSGGLVMGTTSAATLQVGWLPSRSDANTSGRVDGFDLARLARANGSRRCTQEEANAGSCDPNATPFYDPTVDFDGDKAIDGVDLTFFATVFGDAF